MSDANIEQRIQEVSKLIQDFSKKYFKEAEMSESAIKLWQELVGLTPERILKGNTVNWAAAVIYVVARQFQLFDRTRPDRLSSHAIGNFFKTNVDTVYKRAREIEDMLKIKAKRPVSVVPEPEAVPDDLWKILFHNLRTGFDSYHADADLLYQNISGNEHLKNDFRNHAIILKYIIDRESQILRQEKLTDPCYDEGDGAFRSSPMLPVMSLLEIAGKFLHPTMKHGIYDCISGKIDDLEVTHTYWTLRSAIQQRIEYASVKNDDSARFGNCLEIADLIIADSYHHIRNRLEAGTFPEMLIRLTPKPFAYFEKRSTVRPVQSDGIILTSGIGIPLITANAIWNGIACLHELGHDFDRKFALSDYFLRNALDDALGTDGDFDCEILDIWLGWLREILADTIGVLLLGPAYIHSLLRTLLQVYGTKNRDIGNKKRPHVYIRGAIMVEVLELLAENKPDDYGYLVDEAQNIADIWTKMFIPKIETLQFDPIRYSLHEITNIMPGFIKSMLHTPIEVLHGKSLRDIFVPFRKDEHENIDMIKTILLQNHPKNILDRVYAIVPPDSDKASLSIIAASHMAFQSSFDRARQETNRADAIVEKARDIARDIHLSSEKILEDMRKKRFKRLSDALPVSTVDDVREKLLKPLKMKAGSHFLDILSRMVSDPARISSLNF